MRKLPDREHNGAEFDDTANTDERQHEQGGVGTTNLDAGRDNQHQGHDPGHGHDVDGPGSKHALGHGHAAREYHRLRRVVVFTFGVSHAPGGR